jgi:tRNA 2-thiocytidine biosynthesis protein TtcA
MNPAWRELNRLAGKGLVEYNMIADGERVLVGLSGGKDSLALLYYLNERLPRLPLRYELIAAHLNLGYEDPGQTRRLSDFVGQLGVASVFEDTDIAPRAHSEANRENPCFLCARLRRRRLFELARDHGCAKIALGHHRDDLIETLLMNILYSGEISTMLPVQPFFDGLLTVIRPFYRVPEDLIDRNARRWELPVIPTGCPSEGETKRGRVKAWLAAAARKNDKVRGNAFRALSNWRPDFLLPRAGAAKAAAANPGQTLRTKGVKTMGEEQRRRTRVNFQTEADVAAGERRLTGLTTRDLSLKGLFVVSDETFPEQTPVSVILRLTGSTSDLALNMDGRVVRTTAEGMAIDFVEIDLDSFFHLRNIVQLNTGEPAEIDEELTRRTAF